MEIIRNKYMSDNIDSIKDIKVKHAKEIDTKDTKYKENLQKYEAMRNKQEDDKINILKEDLKHANSKIREFTLNKFKCDECNKNPQNKSEQTTHIETEHVKIHKCYDCDFKSNWFVNLKEHILKKKCNKIKKRTK